MTDRNSIHTGLPILDMVFNAYTQMFDVQRNMLTGGFAATMPNAFAGAKPSVAYRGEMRNEVTIDKRNEVTIDTEEQKVIPLTREELRIGKRLVESSKAYKIATRVIEVPVEQEVTLMTEHVHVERRPRTGATQSSGAPTFRDEMIEVHERHEEPVVTKVVTENEEVVVYKTRSERRQMIRDKVRETRLDVREENGAERVTHETGTTPLRAVAGNKPELRPVDKPENEQHPRNDKDDDETRRRRRHHNDD